jgi:hypothetical protein
VRFHRIFPECAVYTGPLGFGLNSKGETLQLWDANGILMDSLSYDNKSPWPNKPDGQGPTLELITPAADNSDPANWQASDHFGSPGAANDQEKDFRSTLCDSLLITEINYHSAPDTDAGDWLELYNGSAQSIELSGWQFWDENGDCYQFPPAVSLAGHTYMVLVQDSVLFHTVFPWCADFIGSLGFGLNNGGEFLCLQDSTGLIVDSLRYDDQPPWPPEPDGNGPTLALIDLSADNSDPANWQASTGKGTPGQPNTPQNPDTSQTGTSTTDPLPLDFKLLANYPNPFNPETTIPYTVPRTAIVVIQIYDVLGRAVRTWEAKTPQGRHVIIWDGRNEQGEYMPAGVYIVRLRAGQFQDQKKMILLK